MCGVDMESILTDADLKSFVWDLAKEGYLLQLISLAGLHTDAVSFGKRHLYPLDSQNSHSLRLVLHLFM